MELKQENKLLIMIMCGGDYPTNDKYNKIEESIVNTWFQQKNDLVKIIIYKYEDVSEIIFDEEKRILKIPYGVSLLGTGLDKTIRAFEWVSKNIEFDFLIRCNAGAFIDFDEALRFIQTKQSKNLYCGHKIDKFNNAGDQIVKKFDVQYVQGSCILFSKDVIQIFNRDDYFLDYCEDVSIGFYLMSKGITIDESNHRIDICDNQIYFTKNSVDSEQVEYYYHFRLRSSDRDFDIKSMKMLWDNKTNGQFPIYKNKLEK
jgi:hypothetical protein